MCVCFLTRLQLTSTPLQVLFYFNKWYFAAFYLVEVLIFIYKGLSTSASTLQQEKNKQTTVFWRLKHHWVLSCLFLVC